MQRERALRWAGALAAVCAVAGCTSLLGDFTTGPGSGGGAEAGGLLDGQGSNVDGGLNAASDAGFDATTDAGPNDGGVTDASDASADASPLDCGTWAYPSPIVLETLSTGTRRVEGSLSVAILTNGDVRVVAGKNGTEPFTVYTVERSLSDGSPPVTVLSPATSYFQSFTASIHRSPGNTNYTVLLASTRGSSMVSATYEAFILQDSMSSSGPIPAPFAVYQLTPAQAAPPAVHSLPYSTTEVLTFVETGSSAIWSLGAGIATSTAPIATLFPIASSSYQDDFNRSAYFHDSVNNTAYVYATNDNASPGVSAWGVPDSLPADAAAPQKRAVSALGSNVRSIGENSSGLPAADIAYEESLTNVSGLITGVNVRAGTIPYAASTPDLDTWVSTDLPIVKSFGNVFNAPSVVSDVIGGNSVTCGSIWSKDQYMALGPGVRAGAVLDSGNGGVPFGLNALWFDATGIIHSDLTGNSRLLPSLGDIVTATAEPISLPSNGAGARWAIAYVETKADDAGGYYDVVEYNELTCQ